MRGAWFVLSEEGKRVLPRLANRYGVIVGESRDGRCWNVHPTGTSMHTSYSVHKSFIDVVENGEGPR